MAEEHPSFIAGLALRDRHRWKSAVEAFERVLVDHPDDALAQFWLAASLDNRGDEVAAIPRYRGALAGGLAGKRRAQAWLWLASSLSKTGASAADVRAALDAADAAGGYRPREEYQQLHASIERRLARRR